MPNIASRSVNLIPKIHVLVKYDMDNRAKSFPVCVQAYGCLCNRLLTMLCDDLDTYKLCNRSLTMLCHDLDIHQLCTSNRSLTLCSVMT